MADAAAIGVGEAAAIEELRRQPRQTVPGLPSAAWLRFRVGDADESLWPQRRFRPALQPRLARLLTKVDTAVRDRRDTLQIWGSSHLRREFLQLTTWPTL
jgi:hypothetical protein